MEIYNPHQDIPKRKTFEEVVNPAACLKPQRIKILANTMIRGRMVWPGSVFEFDRHSPHGYEDIACLTSADKAVTVPLSTPLFTAPEPKPIAGPSQRK